MRRFGEPAPGPGEDLGLVVPPDPRGWAAIPSWEWLAAGVDPGRSRTVVRAVGHAGRLEECADLPADQARARLTALPGVGRWTWAEVAQRALGLPDEVSFGDYHVAKDIGWALTGTPVDDDGLAELLEPYAGHRYRVQRLLELGGHHRPRRGPRMSIADPPAGARPLTRRTWRSTASAVRPKLDRPFGRDWCHNGSMTFDTIRLGLRWTFWVLLWLMTGLLGAVLFLGTVPGAGCPCAGRCSPWCSGSSPRTSAASCNPPPRRPATDGSARWHRPPGDGGSSVPC